MTHACWNCCGLRGDDTVCPNCGHETSIVEWEVEVITDAVGGELIWNGEPGRTFCNLGPLRSDAPGLLSYAVNEEWVQVAVEKPNVAALFVKPEHVASDAPFPLIMTDEPEYLFHAYHNYLAGYTEFYGKEQESKVDESANVHESVTVSTMGVRIGARALIFPGANLWSGTMIANDAFVGANAVIGAGGARWVYGEKLMRVVHAGSVEIGPGAHIGVNCTIVRSVWREPTRIDGYVGNAVSIGHNCVVERGAEVLPGAVLCGSVTVKRGARVSPGAVISNGVTIGEDAWVTLGAVVTRDVPPGQKVSGNFAVPHRNLIDWVKQLAIRRKP